MVAVYLRMCPASIKLPFPRRKTPFLQIAGAEYALAELPTLNPKNRIAGSLALCAAAAAAGAGRDEIMHPRLESE